MSEFIERATLGGAYTIIVGSRNDFITDGRMRIEPSVLPNDEFLETVGEDDVAFSDALVGREATLLYFAINEDIMVPETGRAIVEQVTERLITYLGHLSSAETFREDY